MDMNKMAKVLADLLRELSSELDLHYDHDGLARCHTTIEVMSAAAADLVAIGGDVPEVYWHILARYEAARASGEPQLRSKKEDRP